MSAEAGEAIDTNDAPKRQENSDLLTLTNAFPQVDEAVVAAVLTASGGHLERAFDALLGMSDPDYQPEPLVSSRSFSTNEENTKAQEQIHADELLARQLASQSRYPAISHARMQNNVRESPEHSFIDDELPIIKENIIQGYNETKVKVSSFINNIRNQYIQKTQVNEPTRATLSHSTTDSARNDRASAQFDTDPDAVAVIDDDFEQLHLEDNSNASGTSKLTPHPEEQSRWQPLGSKHPSGRKSPFELGDEDE